MAEIIIKIEDFKNPRHETGKTTIRNEIAQFLKDKGYKVAQLGSNIRSNYETGKLAKVQDYLIMDSGVEGKSARDKICNDNNEVTPLTRKGVSKIKVNFTNKKKPKEIKRK